MDVHHPYFHNDLEKKNLEQKFLKNFFSKLLNNFSLILF